MSVYFEALDAKEAIVDMQKDHADGFIFIIEVILGFRFLHLCF